MGLDCYIVHGNDRDKAFTSEDDDRIENVQLCGGLFSGNGFDGSFRGKVYDPLIQELSEGQHTWYIDQEDEDAYIPSDKLKEQAELLSDLLTAVVSIIEEENETMDDDTIVYQTHKRFSPYEEEYTYREVHDLMTLLRVASERRAVMCVWY